MKINRVSNSDSEKDLFNILKKANKINGIDNSASIKKEALLNLLMKLTKYSAALGGIGFLGFKGYRYFTEDETPDFSKMFSEDQETRTFFAKNSEDSHDIAKKNISSIEALFEAIDKKSKKKDFEISEDDKSYLEQETKKDLEKSLDEVYERYGIDASIGKDNLIKKYANSIDKQEAIFALNFFAEGKGMVHEALYNYYAAHKKAQDSVSIFNFIPSIET